MLNALEKQLSQKYIRLIKAIYNDPSATIYLENMTSNAFDILKGVRQGDPISPKLFIAAMDDVCRNLKWQSQGIGSGW